MTGVDELFAALQGAPTEVVVVKQEPSSAYPLGIKGRALQHAESIIERECARSVVRVYGCLAVLDLDGVCDEVQPQTCGEPSVFFAKGNDAGYGHVCRACWEAFDEPERGRYAERRMVLDNAAYGKFATLKLPGSGGDQ